MTTHSKDTEQQPGSDSSPGTVRSSSTDQKPKRPGHGRMAASAYTGAEVVICQHPDYKAGDHCPDPLCRGHLYPVSSATIFIQLTGQPLVGAMRYEQEVLRCSACLERLTAPMKTLLKPWPKMLTSLPWVKLDIGHLEFPHEALESFVVRFLLGMA